MASEDPKWDYLYALGGSRRRRKQSAGHPLQGSLSCTEPNTHTQLHKAILPGLGNISTKSALPVSTS
ncbi:hypothetical protein BDV98DRAFT_570701 [Pterulicium gracile]|uniref:Uncharacterized protein n=1 Tax=Pterulicium gracile TaxID=1884261 RepID=A0A5C3QDS8_9AGAR|nr:hypothetical protein BDV98DRAFT_570701 [Pterula gracilis]